MPIIAAKELTKSYGTRSILGGVSLTIDEGERVGLIGSNGSGKSTLARILAGLELPDGGEVIRRRDLRVAILDQVPHLPAGASAGAAVLAGLDAWRAAQQRYTRATAELTAPTLTPRLRATSRWLLPSTHFCLRISRIFFIVSRFAISPPRGGGRATYPRRRHCPRPRGGAYHRGWPGRPGVHEAVIPAFTSTDFGVHTR